MYILITLSFSLSLKWTLDSVRRMVEPICYTWGNLSESLIDCVKGSAEEALDSWLPATLGAILQWQFYSEVA